MALSEPSTPGAIGGASQARLVARNTGIQAAGEVLSRAASLAFYVIMARELGKRGFGDFMFSASVIVFIELAGIGTDLTITREVARNRDAVHRLFWNTLAIKLVLGSIGIAIAMAVVVLGSYDTDVRLAVAILAAAGLVELGAKTIHATFRGIERMWPIAVALVVQRSATAVVGIIALLAGAQLLAVSSIYLGGAVLGAVTIALALGRTRIRPRFAVSLRESRSIASDALPLGVAIIFGALLARLDTMLLSLIEGNVAVGVYSAAYRPYEAVNFIAAGFGLAVLPSLSRLGRSTEPTLARAFETGCKVIALALVPIGLAFIVFPTSIVLTMYGDGYADAAAALRALGAGTLVYGFFMLGTQVLTAQRRQRVIAIGGGTALALNALFNLLLIPRYEATGAGIAMALTVGFFATWMVVATRRVTGPVRWLRVVVGPLAGACAMLAVAAVAGTGLIVLPLALLAFAAVAALVEWRVFPDDFRLLVASVRTRRAASLS